MALWAPGAGDPSRVGGCARESRTCHRIRGLQPVPVAGGCADDDFSTVCPGILWLSPADWLGLFGSAPVIHPLPSPCPHPPQLQGDPCQWVRDQPRPHAHRGVRAPASPRRYHMSYWFPPFCCCRYRWRESSREGRKPLLWWLVFG